MKFLVALVCLAAVVAAEPEADASYLYGGYAAYPSYGYNYGTYGYGYPAYAYAGYGGYGYGAHLIGKRDAEADAAVLAYTTPYVYAPYYYQAGSSYQHVATPFHVSAHSQIHKREAEADAAVLAYNTPYVYSPYYYPAASSYQHVATPFSVSAVSQIHKREAEPQGVAVHPGLATSSTFRSVQGASAYALVNPYSAYAAYPYNYHLIGKRDAEPQGVAVHPDFATSSTFRSVQGASALSLGYPYAYNYYPSAYAYAF